MERRGRHWFVENVLQRGSEPTLSRHEAAQAHRVLGAKLKGQLPPGVNQYVFMSKFLGRDITSFSQITRQEALRLWQELHRADEGESYGR